MKRTLPFGSFTFGPEEVSAPIIKIVKKIKTNAVPRFSITVLAFSKKRPSQEKIDLSAFMQILQN
mgnify:CR=1 FL=1